MKIEAVGRKKFELKILVVNRIMLAFNVQLTSIN